MKTYQLARFSFGNARSLAPIIMGTRKFPSVFGMEGIRKNQTMMMPCMVKSLLYVSAVKRLVAGVSNSSRISRAKNPPRKKNAVIEAVYKMPIRLWSVVSSHDQMPCLSLM
jgi:hypothetical protein